MPSFTPAPCARRIDGIARLPAAAAAPSAVVAINLRRLKGFIRSDMVILPLSFSLTRWRPNHWVGLVNQLLFVRFLALAGPAGDRRPGARIGYPRAHEIDLEGVTVGPIQRVQMLDATTALVVDDAQQFDQRRAGAHAERFRHVGCGKSRADALARALGLHASALEQFEQRPRGQFLLAKRHRHALRNMRGEIRERKAIDRTHAHRALQHLIGPDAECLRDEAFRLSLIHISEPTRLGMSSY